MNSFARTIAYLALTAAIFLPSQGNSQHKQISVRYASDAKISASISAFARGKLLYASADDIATALGMTPRLRDGGKRLEIIATSTSLFLADSNCFVVFVDPARKERVFQLSSIVLFSRGTHYVPARSFLEALASAFPVSARLDQSTMMLYVERPGPAVQFDVTSLAFDEKSNGMIIRIPLARPPGAVEHWLKSDGWLYVTIGGVRGNVKKLERTPPDAFVKKVMAVQSEGSLQLSFNLNKKVESAELTTAADSTTLEITLRTPAEATTNYSLEHRRERWHLDVIVIDAGHGGRDWGASGVTGVREKDVTLAVALKLGTLIKKSIDGVSVVYTRKDDRFVELDRRGRIANEADGKLFISIHCNSLKRKPRPTRGFEVYLLRPGRTEEAVSIAERENAVIQMEEGFEERYKHLTDENFILTTMAQSAYVRASEVFADILQNEMATHAGIPNRGVKQAGFYVLVGASMPNVLVETAYLSNREDERFLRSDAGQQKIAEAILRAVRKYLGEYEKLLNEGKTVGQR